MLLPTNIATGRVTGQFLAGVVDGVDDDQDPDAVPAAGFVTFTASVPYLPDPTAAPNPATILTTSVVAVLDNEGYLCTPASGTLEPSYRGVRLIATDDPDLSVSGWTWNATYSFSTVAGQKLAIPTHSFAVPSDGVVDLTTAVKVPSSTGIGTEQAEALAASAQAAAIQSAQDAATAAQAAVDAAGAAQVTDANISALVGNPASDTADAVTALVVTAAADKLNVDDAINTYQSRAALDAAAAAKVSTGGTATNTAVKAIADAAAGPKLAAADLDAASAALVGNAGSSWWVALLAWLRTLFVGKGDQVLSAKDYGVKGDGTTDDTAALNTALTAAAGKTLLLPLGGTVKVTGLLTIPSGITLDGNGATIDATGLPAGTGMGLATALTANGTIGTSVQITAPIAQWARVITGITSTTGLAAGDLIRIRNFEASVPGIGSTKDKGELLVIGSVDSPTQVTLTTGVNTAFANDSNLYLSKITPVQDVTLKNFQLTLGGIGSRHSGARFQYARNVKLNGVRIKGAEDAGVTFAHTWGCEFSDGAVDGSTSPDIYNTGYGVSLEDATKFARVTRNRFTNCRSFVNGGGTFPAANVDVSWNHGHKATTVGFGAHEPCFYWRIAHNTVIGADIGVQFRGQHGKIEYNTILDAPGSGVRIYADETVTSQADITIRGNNIEKCGTGINVDGAVVTGTSVESVKRGVKIVDNEITNTTYDAILLRNFDGASIIGNAIDGALQNGMNITGLSGTSLSKSLRIGANQIRNVTLVGIKVKWVNDIDIQVGVIDTTGDRAILLDTCVGTSTSGGSIRRATGGGIRIVNGSIHTVTPGTIKDLVGATADAVVAVTANDTTITGGIATGVRYGVYTSGCDRVIVGAVNAQASGSSGTKILLETMTTYKLYGNIGTSNPVS